MSRMSKKKSTAVVNGEVIDAKLKFALRELDKYCKISEDDADIDGINFKLLKDIIDADKNGDIISKRSTFGKYKIRVGEKILPFLEKYPSATIHGFIARDSNGTIHHLYLRGMTYVGKITEEVLIDFFVAFRFAEAICIYDDSLYAFI